MFFVRHQVGVEITELIRDCAKNPTRTLRSRLGGGGAQLYAPQKQSGKAPHIL